MVSEEKKASMEQIRVRYGKKNRECMNEELKIKGKEGELRSENEEKCRLSARRERSRKRNPHRKSRRITEKGQGMEGGEAKS